MVLIVLPLLSWKIWLISGVDGIATLKLGVLEDDVLLEDNDDPLTEDDSAMNNEVILVPCISVETVAGVILPFDGVSILVVVLLELLYEDCGSFKQNCTCQGSWEIQLLDRKAPRLQALCAYIMSSVLSSISIGFGIFAIPPVLFKHDVPAKLLIFMMLLIIFSIVSDASTNVVVISIGSSFATTEKRSRIVCVDI